MNFIRRIYSSINKVEKTEIGADFNKRLYGRNPGPSFHDRCQSVNTSADKLRISGIRTRRDPPDLISAIEEDTIEEET